MQTPRAASSVAAQADYEPQNPPDQAQNTELSPATLITLARLQAAQHHTEITNVALNSENTSDDTFGY